MIWSVNRGLLVVTCAVLAMSSAVAHAGPFGGFSRDGSRYLVGRDRICEPIVQAGDLPSCQKGTSKKIAELEFRKPAAQRGSSATYRASAAGTAIEVHGSDASPVARWDSGGTVSKVTSIYADDKLGLVAVEYQTRAGGRMVENVIAMRLPSTKAGGKVGAGGKGSMRVGQDAKGKDPGSADGADDRPPPDDPKFRSAVEAGRKLAKRRKHAQAIAEYDKALAIAADHPEVRYLRAVSLLAIGRTGDAIGELSAIRDSSHSRAPEWMVAARFEKAFAKLRADKKFRAAVGLDGAQTRERGAYERVVGAGGQWEQPPVPCEEPKVNLKLDRTSRKFELVITSRCGGDSDRTRLAGRWRARGTSELQLIFPNQDADDEGLTCKIEICRDSSREDCIRCQPDPETEMLLRAVRR